MSKYTTSGIIFYLILVGSTDLELQRPAPRIIDLRNMGVPDESVNKSKETVKQSQYISLHDGTTSQTRSLCSHKVSPQSSGRRSMTGQWGLRPLTLFNGANFCETNRT